MVRLYNHPVCACLVPAVQLHVTPVHVRHVPDDGRGRSQEVPPRSVRHPGVRCADESGCGGRRRCCSRRGR